MKRLSFVLVALTLGAVLTGGCSSEDSAEVEALQEELAATRGQLEQAREDLVAAKAAVDQADANEAAWLDAFFAGDVDGVMETFTGEPVFQDDTFGDYLEGTLPVRGMETAVIGMTDLDASEVLDRWVASDGSRAVSLWRWTGTNALGGPFDLPTVVIHDYEDGHIAREMIFYAARDAYDQLLSP